MKKILTLALLFCFAIAEDEFFEPTTSLGGYGEMHFDMKANDGDGKLDVIAAGRATKNVVIYWNRGSQESN